MILALYNFKNLAPLLIGWVNTRRVVGTDVKKNNLLICSLIEVLKHAIQVETLSLIIEVTVSLLLEANSAWDCVVNRPCRSRSEYLSSLHWVELLEEFKT